jgi:hypothetical protein
LFLTWDHGRDKEVTRLSAIKELYDGIVTNSGAIFGVNTSTILNDIGFLWTPMVQYRRLEENKAILSLFNN